jgi:hypothetical protein
VIDDPLVTDVAFKKASFAGATCVNEAVTDTDVVLTLTVQVVPSTESQPLHDEKLDPESAVAVRV